jgi:hypothetical protein
MPGSLHPEYRGKPADASALLRPLVESVRAIAKGCNPAHGSSEHQGNDDSPRRKINPATRHTRVPERPRAGPAAPPPAGLPISGGARIPDSTGTPRTSRLRPFGRRRQWDILSKSEASPGNLGSRVPACLPPCYRGCRSAGLPAGGGRRPVQTSHCGHDGRGCLGTHWFHCVVEVGVPARKLASPASTRGRSNQPPRERPVEPDAMRMACPCSTEAGSSKSLLTLSVRGTIWAFYPMEANRGDRDRPRGRLRAARGRDVSKRVQIPPEG